MTKRMVEVELKFSGQAQDLLAHLPHINKEDIIKWFVEDRKISIGGGDVLDFLKRAKKP